MPQGTIVGDAAKDYRPGKLRRVGVIDVYAEGEKATLLNRFRSKPPTWQPTNEPTGGGGGDARGGRCDGVGEREEEGGGCGKQGYKKGKRRKRRKRKREISRLIKLIKKRIKKEKECEESQKAHTHTSSHTAFQHSPRAPRGAGRRGGS